MYISSILWLGLYVLLTLINNGHANPTDVHIHLHKKMAEHDNVSKSKMTPNLRKCLHPPCPWDRKTEENHQNRGNSCITTYISCLNLNNYGVLSNNC